MNKSTANWIRNTVQYHRCSKRVPISVVANDVLCPPCRQLAELFPDSKTYRRRRDHSFVTFEMATTIPALYVAKSMPGADKTLHAHYLLDGRDWYIADLDQETGRAFCNCRGFLG